MDELKKENDRLKKELKEMKEKEEKTWDKYIDEFVDEWYENNKDEVNIGRIKLFNILPIDLVPDSCEKNIYKKTLKIIISMLGDAKLPKNKILL